MLVKYYDIFKKLDHNLKITGIFTYGANEDSESRDEHSRDALERIITDYNKQFGKISLQISSKVILKMYPRG